MLHRFGKRKGIEMGTRAGLTEAKRNSWLRRHVISQSVFSLLVSLVFLCGALSFSEESRVVRVGIFQNRPIVFQGNNGTAQGFYVDLINAIAHEENWEVEYVFSSWDGCLRLLQNGRIDLITSIAYTEEQDTYCDFSQQVVWTLWGTVLVHADSNIDDVAGLNGKRVAVLRNGINGINFMKLLDEFDVSCEILETPSYDAALRIVESGEASAAVVNSAYAAIRSDDYNAKSSSIVFSPINAFFAAPEGKSSDLLRTVDFYVGKWKRDKSSIYYKSMQNWLISTPTEVFVTPTWTVALLLVILMFAIFLLAWTRLLKRQVKERMQAEEALARYAETQAVLVREVDHRVKNNLSAIMSLLHKEEDRAEEEGRLADLTIVRDLESRIKGLSSLHSLLSASGWHPLGISQICGHVVRAVIQSVPRSKQVTLSVAPSPVMINTGQAHHLTLVINELATNSVKYALGKRDTADISVDISREDDAVSVTFRDDGPGFPEQMLDGDFSCCHVGFELIRGIVAQSLDGELNLDNDNGAVATIKFTVADAS